MTQSHGPANHTAELWGGAALLAAALAALLTVNLGGAEWYAHLWHTQVTVGIAPLALTKTLHHWVNDGLMVLFFVVVGIEIHREMRMGSLQKPAQALVPVAAAVGGFVMPALLFVAATLSWPEIRAGWSIPTATDIAFAVALMTALRAHVPASLRGFLLALAVVDDLLAIAVIALFYTADVVWMNLFLAIMGVGVLLAKKYLKIQLLSVYVLIGFFMWLCVLKSGVHATVAGVIIGLLLPLKGVKGKEAPATVVEHALAPWVRWLVVPLFAFANVGVDLRGSGWEAWLAPLTLGIAAALVVGKQVGVLGTVWLLEKGGWGHRPKGASWRHMYGTACLCGIGFTMSLFIGALAFSEALQPQVRMGVLAGSIVAACMAVAVLRR